MTATATAAVFLEFANLSLLTGLDILKAGERGRGRKKEKALK